MTSNQSNPDRIPAAIHSQLSANSVTVDAPIRFVNHWICPVRFAAADIVVTAYHIYDCFGEHTGQMSPTLAGAQQYVRSLSNNRSMSSLRSPVPFA